MLPALFMAATITTAPSDDYTKIEAAQARGEGVGVTLRDCLFKPNDNGLTGGSQDSTAVVEFAEFDSNGNTNAASPTHNIYVYGGTFTMRYSYLHDPAQAQNFHVRATQALIES